MAVNCCVAPKSMTGLGGVIAIDVSVTIVNCAVLEVTPLKLAVIVVVPAATDVANPVVLIAATAVLEEPQVTEVVISFVELSE